MGYTAQCYLTVTAFLLKTKRLIIHHSRWKPNFNAILVTTLKQLWRKSWVIKTVWLRLNIHDTIYAEWWYIMRRWHNRRLYQNLYSDAIWCRRFCHLWFMWWRKTSDNPIMTCQLDHLKQTLVELDSKDDDVHSQNAFQNVVCKMAVVLFRARYMKYNVR